MIVSTANSINKNIGLLKFLPAEIRRLCDKLNFDNLREIRLRLSCPLSVIRGEKVMYLNASGNLTKRASGGFIIKKGHIDDALSLISRGSIYAYEEEIAQGYITVEGGHRVGLCGRVVLKDGKISSIKDISGLNYRYARQIFGCSDKVVNAIADGDIIKNTLIISPPGCGKTTMLRDIAYNLSVSGIKVLIVDERCEIAAMSAGQSSFDLGANCDVLDLCPKAEGIVLGIRSMSPQVIITDEIGTESDIGAIKKAICSGVSIVTSIHSSDRKKLEERADLSELPQMFDCIITLSSKLGPCTIDEIFKR